MGTVPAEDIDIHLHFPDGFELVDSADYPKPPTEPNTPYKPKNRLDIPGLGISGFPRIHIPNPQNMNIDSERPTIRKSNSYDVDYNRSYLKHNYNSPRQFDLQVQEFGSVSHKCKMGYIFQ
jgi:hypothetical protein